MRWWDRLLLGSVACSVGWEKVIYSIECTSWLVAIFGLSYVVWGSAIMWQQVRAASREKPSLQSDSGPEVN